MALVQGIYYYSVGICRIPLTAWLGSSFSRHIATSRIPENHDFSVCCVSSNFRYYIQYWFSVLGRISPSAVATYRNMNE